MSRIFEALQQSNPQRVSPPAIQEIPLPDSALIASVGGEHLKFDTVATFQIPPTSDEKLVVFAEPQSLASTKVKALSARLRHVQQVRGIRKVLVTSAARGDGKTTASANLAIALAAQGDRTLLIDGDLHEPSLHKLFHLDNKRGFSDWSAEQPINSLLRRAADLPLWFLPAGSGQYSLIRTQSSTTPELLKQMTSAFSWIVIDSPPLLPQADSSIWNTMVDGVLLVIRQGITPRKVLVKSLESFDKSKLLGLIMNDAVSSQERYYRGYYLEATSRTKRSRSS